MLESVIPVLQVVKAAMNSIPLYCLTLPVASVIWVQVSLETELGFDVSEEQATKLMEIVTSAEAIVGTVLQQQGGVV